MILTTSGRRRRRVENTWAALYDLLSALLPAYLVLSGILANMVLFILIYDRVVH